MVSQLSVESRKKLLAVSSLKIFPAHSIIWERSSTQRQLLYVESGGVRSHIASGSAPRFGYAEWGPGNWLGEAFMVLEGDTIFHVEAVENSVLRLVERDDFEDLMATDAHLACDVARLIASRYRQVLRWVEETLSLPIPERIATELLRHARPRSHGGTVFWGTQDSLASCLALSRPTVSKVLKNWERMGLIELNYGSILILDGNRLMATACGVNMDCEPVA